MRGEIVNVARAQQINDFSGLIYGKITPTDIDGMIEYKNKGYVFFEVKYKDKDLPFGQRLALERLVNDVSTKDKKSIALIIEHYISDTNEGVPIAECYVREIYYCGEKKWRKPKYKNTSKQLINTFTNYLDKIIC